CVPEQWIEKPKEFDVIKDKSLRSFAYKFNEFWKLLCRRVIDDVGKDERAHCFTLLPIQPKEIIIPGGRFRENHCWDNYWITRGLRISGLSKMSINLRKACTFLLRQHHFSPVANRIYYMGRTHPPMFAPMVYEEYLATLANKSQLGTLEKSTIRQFAKEIETDLKFWNEYRSVDLSQNNWRAKLYQYRSNLTVPR
ncbi:hypothetical protein OESDEN_22907, partial [Oesophagostomum dentatum]